MKFIAACIVALLGLLLTSSPAQAQNTPTTPPSAPAQKLVRVFVTCEGCDLAALKTEVTFVEYVDDRAKAGVEIAIAPAQTEAVADRVWTIIFTGHDVFQGQDRKLSVTVPSAATAADLRAALARVVKFGLVEYAHRSDAGAQLDVTMRPTVTAEGEAGGAAAETHDPWNHWVYRLSFNGNQYAEVSSGNKSFSTSASANRTTEAWKMYFSAYKSESQSRFVLSDTDTIRTDQTNWSVDSQIVKSLNGHWSAGITAGASSSTYSNFKLSATVTPAVEFDVFPYSESSKRSLTIQYSVGPSRYEYRELTIFDKLKETLVKQRVDASLGLRQPWGSVGASASFSQVLNSPEQNRVSVYGNMSVRIFKGFSVNGSVGYSRIRDQFYLEKSDATPEEILLRLRQLATGYSYNASFGFSYSFGSLSNATVNPRFGG